MFYIPEGGHVVELLTPATDAAGRTGGYISLKSAQWVYIVCHMDQGNAATITWTPEQASKVDGTGTKALTNNVPIWADEDLAASDVPTRQTDAANFTTSAAIKHKMLIFSIDPASLDSSSSFDCITVKTGASDAANITSAVAIIVPRYHSASPISAIVD